MRAAGFDRAFVDEAGNAVGELAASSAARTIVLLGHIDTVPGNIPVRIDGDRLYGRGSVDAKGPLATFVAGAARFGSAAANAAESPNRCRRRRRRGSGNQQGRTRSLPRVSTAIPIAFPTPASSVSRVTGIASRLATKADCCSISPPINRWRTPPARRQRRVSSRRLVELGHGACRASQRRQRQGVRSADAEPSPLHHRDH